jgi:hypothetical protein
MSKPHKEWTVDERTGTVFYDGPTEDHAGFAHPIDDRGRAQRDLILHHAAGTAYELVEYPWRKRQLHAEFVQPLCWPDGTPYKTEVFRVDLDVADRDIEWDKHLVAERELCDGRKVTLRMPMRAFTAKDYVRVAQDPVVVDVAAISPPVPVTDLVPATEGNLSAVASSMESAARALSEAAAMSAPRSPPVKRVQFYDKDGEPSHSATVTTERRGGKIIQHMLKGAESIELDDLDGNSHDVDVRDVHIHVDVPEQRPRTARAKREPDGSLTLTYDDAVS